MMGLKSCGLAVLASELGAVTAQTRKVLCPIGATGAVSAEGAGRARSGERAIGAVRAKVLRAAGRGDRVRHGLCFLVSGDSWIQGPWARESGMTLFRAFFVRALIGLSRFGVR